MWHQTCCFHYMGYSFRLAARVLLYAPYHDHWYTSCGALAGTRYRYMVRKGKELLYLMTHSTYMVRVQVLCKLKHSVCIDFMAHFKSESFSECDYFVISVFVQWSFEKNICYKPVSRCTLVKDTSAILICFFSYININNAELLEYSCSIFMTNNF